MAEENNDEDLSLEGAAGSKGGNKKKFIILAAIILLLVGGGAAYFLLSGDSSEVAAEKVEPLQKPTGSTAKNGPTTYVAMPRPFVFNVMEGKRERLVQIKVQLVVHGSENALLLKKHIPLLEATLVRVFSAASAEQLRSPAGKKELREYSFQALNEVISQVENAKLISSVLFTGFVLQ